MPGASAAGRDPPGSSGAHKAPRAATPRCAGRGRGGGGDGGWGWWGWGWWGVGLVWGPRGWLGGEVGRLGKEGVEGVIGSVAPTTSCRGLVSPETTAKESSSIMTRVGPKSP